jgi:hypothetical protein
MFYYMKSVRSFDENVLLELIDQVMHFIVGQMECGAREGPEGCGGARKG